MNISTKASIVVSGTVSADEVKSAVIAAVKSNSIKDDSSLTLASSSVTVAEDGSATIEIVYEKGDAEPVTVESDQSDGSAVVAPKIVANPVVTPIAPSVVLPGLVIPTAG